MVKEKWKLCARAFVLLSKWWSTMTSKETPTKIYGAAKTNFDPSSCRLCRAIGDSRYCKNVFKPSNFVILNSVQILHGAELVQDKSLPHLVCRACERKLKNFIAFKAIIDGSQRYFLQADAAQSRVKRCIEVSPSVSKPPLKTRTSSASRSLTFSGAASSEVSKFISFEIIYQGRPRLGSIEYYIIVYKYKWSSCLWAADCKNWDR